MKSSASRERVGARGALPARRAWGVAAALGACLVLASPASGVVIKSGNGTGNTTPPTDDPGFSHVGIVNSLSAVYLGNRWVLTANHVGQGSVKFDGVVYPDVPGSTRRLTTPGGNPADLRLFKLQEDPGLPPMNVASISPSPFSSLVMIGNGQNRGQPISWRGADGWQHGQGRNMRWGTNRVDETDLLVIETAAFKTVFEETGVGVGEHEAQPAVGDSGGAVFFKRVGNWELTGIMFANVLNAPDQPSNYVLFGNGAIIADLSVYRSEILSVIGQPTCSDGVDDDGDTLVDYPEDPGCESASDDDERDVKLVCDDGVDGDGDGLVDWPSDPGCLSALDDSEQSDGLVCDDGIDNDGDGFIDHPQDPECNGSPTAPLETSSVQVPLSSGAGASALAMLLGWLGKARAEQSTPS